VQARIGRWLVLVAVACAGLAVAGPGSAQAAGSGQVDVNIVAGSDPADATAGMTYDSNSQTWAPDGSVDPATLNIASFDTNNGDLAVTTASTGASANDTGTIDLQADPAAAGYVDFVPGSSGNIKIDTANVTNVGSEFDGAVQLGEDTTVSGDDFFDGRIDGAHSLTLPNGGQISADIGDTIPLTSLTTEDLLTFDGSAVTTTGPQDYLGGTLGDGLSNGGTANYSPAAPTGITAVGGQGSATVSFTPGAARCSPLTGYEVTAEPGNIHASGTGSPITVSGLRSGTAYTFTVAATNLIGTSAPSVSASATTARIVTASISSPGSGHTYQLGQKVTTRFSCKGLIEGALAACKDSNGAGGGTGRLNTSTPGRHSYVVTATATDGSTTTASISYTVGASNLFTVSKLVAHRGGRVTFTVKLPDAGSVRVLEKAADGTLASATRFAKRATALHVRLTLSKREQRLLANGSIKVSVTVTFSPVGGNPRTIKRAGLRLKR
jgi:Fibronectin type III domain